MKDINLGRLKNKRVRGWIIVAVISIIMYIIWCIFPFFASPVDKIDSSISEADYLELKKIAYEYGLFNIMEISIKDVITCIIDPKTRPKVHISYAVIEEENWEISAGWIRGGLWGQGKTIKIEKINGKYKVVYESSWFI